MQNPDSLQTGISMKKNFITFLKIYIKTHSTSLLRFCFENILFLFFQAIPSCFGIFLRSILYKMIIQSDGLFGIEEDVTITHPKNLILKNGVYICKNSYIGASSQGIIIEENTYISNGSYINVFRYSDKETAIIKIGKNCFFAAGVVIHGHNSVYIGDESIFGPNSVIITGNHGKIYAETKYRYAHIPFGLPVIIGKNCWIGANVKILSGVTIGDNTVIGAGSVVTHNIPPSSLAYGNPARIHRAITEE